MSARTYVGPRQQATEPPLRSSGQGFGHALALGGVGHWCATRGCRGIGGSSMRGRQLARQLADGHRRPGSRRPTRFDNFVRHILHAGRFGKLRVLEVVGGCPGPSWPCAEGVGCTASSQSWPIPAQCVCRSRPKLTPCRARFGAEGGRSRASVCPLRPRFDRCRSDTPQIPSTLGQTRQRLGQHWSEIGFGPVPAQIRSGLASVSRARIESGRNRPNSGQCWPNFGQAREFGHEPNGRWLNSARNRGSRATRHRWRSGCRDRPRRRLNARMRFRGRCRQTESQDGRHRSGGRHTLMAQVDEDGELWMRTRSAMR